MRIRHEDRLGTQDPFKDPYTKHSELGPARTLSNLQRKVQFWYLGGELVYQQLELKVTKRALTRP